MPTPKSNGAKFTNVQESNSTINEDIWNKNTMKKKKEMYYFCLYQMNKNIIYQEQQWVWNWWFVRKLKLIKL